MTDRLITAAPALVLFAAIAVTGIWAIVHSIRAGRHHLPAAPDNQPGRDIGLLQECRLIALEPPTNPDISRDAWNYLRKKGEQP